MKIDISTTFPSQKILISGSLADNRVIEKHKNIYAVRSVSDLRNTFNNPAFQIYFQIFSQKRYILANLGLSKTDKMENMKSLQALGRTDIMVTPIGLGCWQFSKQKNLAGKFWPALEDNLIERIVSLSIEGGINWFDTAEVYGGGKSEKALSKALQAAGKKPGEVTITIKSLRYSLSFL